MIGVTFQHQAKGMLPIPVTLNLTNQNISTDLACVVCSLPHRNRITRPIMVQPNSSGLKEFSRSRNSISMLSPDNVTHEILHQHQFLCIPSHSNA